MHKMWHQFPPLVPFLHGWRFLLGEEAKSKAKTWQQKHCFFTSWSWITHISPMSQVRKIWKQLPAWILQPCIDGIEQTALEMWKAGNPMLTWLFLWFAHFGDLNTFLKAGTESQLQMGKLLLKSLLGGTPKALCPCSQKWWTYWRIWMLLVMSHYNGKIS